MVKCKPWSGQSAVCSHEAPNPEGAHIHTRAEACVPHTHVHTHARVRTDARMQSSGTEVPDPAPDPFLGPGSASDLRFGETH